MSFDMTDFGVVFGMYVVPSAVLVGVTILVAHWRKKTLFRRFEYVTWLVPGLLYWMMFGPLDLEQAFRGKTLANLGEPVLVGLICGVLFVVRTIVGAKMMKRNRAIAWWNLGLSSAAAVAVFVLMPALPE